MGDVVVTGAMLQCDQGVAPSTLNILPVNMVDCGGMAAGTVMDFIPMTNIPPFGMCNSTTNPAVIAATSAAAGVKTPAPCVPVTTSPWSPGASQVGMTPGKVLTKDDTCKCMWAGTISIKSNPNSKVTAS